jgi:hypothetical protein
MHIQARMKFTRTPIVAVLSLALCGCASPTWVRSGATEQDLLTDQYYCERDVRQSNFGETKESDEKQAAGGWTAAGDSIGSGMSSLGAAIGKRQFFDRCMVAHGWRDQNDAETPPPTSPMPIAVQRSAVAMEARPDNLPSLSAAAEAPPVPRRACTAEDREAARAAQAGGFRYSADCD